MRSCIAVGYILPRSFLGSSEVGCNHYSRKSQPVSPVLLRGQGRAFITELRQTLAGLRFHDKLIIHCKLPEKVIKLWERVRELLLASTGLVLCTPGASQLLSPHGLSCLALWGCTAGPWVLCRARPVTPPRAETAPTTTRACGHAVQPSLQGSSPALNIGIYSPALPQCSAWQSRVKEPGHSGHNQTDFLQNMEEPGGWGMIRMVTNPRGCSCVWWIPTAPAGSKEMNISQALSPNQH